MNAASASEIQEQLMAISSWPTDLATLRLTPKDIERSLRNLEDFLVDRHAGLAFSSTEYTQLSSILGCFQSLELASATRAFSAVVTGFAAFIKSSINAKEVAIEPLECFLVLMAAVFASVERRLVSMQEGEGKKPSVSNAKILNEWTHIKCTALEAMKSLLNSGLLNRAYQTYSDLEQASGVIVKILHGLIENQENVKNAQVRALCLTDLALCGTKLNYRNGLKTVIMQDLNYLEFLGDFDAELLATMASPQYFQDATLLDEILHRLGQLRFTGDESSAAKIVGVFLLKLTQLDPKNVLRNIAELADFISSDVPSLRMVMLDVLGGLVRHLHRQEERTDQIKAQTRSFVSAIEERLRDVSAFVRGKVLQVLSELIAANALPVVYRATLVSLVVGRVMDKSSIVRRRAIQLLGELLRTHPFCIDGGELSLSFFEDRLREIDAQLDKNAPSELKASFSASRDDLSPSVPEEENQMDEDSFTDLTTTSPADSSDGGVSLQSLLLQKRYYLDAIAFIKQLDEVIPTLCRLLSSNTKTEVFEVMDFFVDAQVYKLQSSQLGVSKMMHLIWERDLSTEDGTRRSIREHVLLSYKRIFLEVDTRLSGKERTLTITENLLTLVNGCSLSDLASLEQIIIGFMQKGWIPDAVISALGHVFASKTASNSNQTLCRSALILLTMIGGIQGEVIQSRLESIIKIGLHCDTGGDPWIAQYACQALRLITAASSSSNASPVRLPHDNIIFHRLTTLIMNCPCSAPWLQVCSEAIKTIYHLASQPSTLAANILKALSREITLRVKSESLTKMLHVVGCVATGEVAHLQVIGDHWKSTKTSSLSPGGESMEGITASAEDDVNEALRLIRENELLYDKGSLLSVYGRMVANICANNTLYSNVAAMTLAKLMTVSGRYCDEHLSLFLTILERSPDATIRANLCICFADLAQSHPRLIDTNIVYLFRRLGDDSVGVRRNALLVLTHLTLTGMIKVRGQIAEIARCILDDDQRVAELARLFFIELAAKDSVIYNHIPDIISSLSSLNQGIDTDGNDDGDGDGNAKTTTTTTTPTTTTTTRLPAKDFKYICQFIFDFIKKERQMEALVDKLCQRFRQCNSSRPARDLSFCLSLLNYTADRTLRRLIDCFPLYKDYLIDRQVYANFVEISTKAKRSNFAKAELKTLIEEFEKKLLSAAGDHSGMPIDDDEEGLNIKAKDKEKKPEEKTKKTSSASTGASRGGRKARSRITMRRDYAFSSEEDAEAEDDGDGDGDGDVTTTKSAPKRVSAKSPQQPPPASMVAMKDDSGPEDDDHNNSSGDDDHNNSSGDGDHNNSSGDDDILLTAKPILRRPPPSKSTMMAATKPSRKAKPVVYSNDEDEDIF